jgi:hypothetical protein
VYTAPSIIHHISRFANRIFFEKGLIISDIHYFSAFRAHFPLNCMTIAEKSSSLPSVCRLQKPGFSAPKSGSSAEYGTRERNHSPMRVFCRFTGREAALIHPPPLAERGENAYEKSRCT